MNKKLQQAKVDWIEGFDGEKGTADFTNHVDSQQENSTLDEENSICSAKADSCFMLPADNILLDKLADLEHQQWSHLTKYFFGLTPAMIYKNVNKWNNQANTDYKDLSEKDKEKDRVWARKVLDILSQQGNSSNSCLKGVGSVALVKAPADKIVCPNCNEDITYYYKKGFKAGKQELINLINKIFEDDSIYTGRIIKFEIKNNIKFKGEKYEN